MQMPRDRGLVANPAVRSRTENRAAGICHECQLDAAEPQVH